MRNLDLWYSRVDVDDLIAELQTFRNGEGAQAGGQEPRQDAVEGQPEGVREADGDRRRRASDRGRPARRHPDPGPRSAIAAHEFEEFLRGVLRSYRRTLTDDRRRLLERYRYVDAARKVVGVGSVGTRAWIMLLLGRDDDDPLFLQFKEAEASVLEPFLGKSEFANHGQRVVEGQRLTQAASDIMLGWIRADGLDGVKRDFYVRQLWDAKGSALVELMEPEAHDACTRQLCGAELARAHARSGDAIAIASYLGTSDTFDRALARFAESYADQNERDYKTLTKAVENGQITAQTGI